MRKLPITALCALLVSSSLTGCEKEGPDPAETAEVTTIAPKTEAVTEPTTEEPTTAAPTTPEPTEPTTDAALAAEQDEIGQLLELIDVAKTKVDEASNYWDSDELNSRTAQEKFNLRTQVFKAAMDQVGQAKEQALKLKHLRSNVKNAAESYFNSLMASCKNIMGISDFFADYFGFDFGTPPLLKDYEKISDHYNALYEWNNKAKEYIASLDSIPQCLEVEWANYVKAFNLNDEIVKKELMATQYNDWLRYNSARNLTTRYTTLEEKTFNAFLTALKGELNLARNQISSANKLAEEIRSYSEEDADTRAAYEFQKNQDGKISLSFEAIEKIYPALYNTYDAFVILKTGCVSGNRTIVVKAEIPGFTQPFEQTYKLDSSYRSIYIKPPVLSTELNLASAKDAQIKVAVYEKDGLTLIQAQSFPVVIKSINDVEWSSDDFGISTKDNILCFLKPDSDEIDLLKREAINEISKMTDGKIQSLAGYQESQYNHYVGTYLQAAGIMRALSKMGVRYDVGSFSVSGSHQRVRFPDEVLTKKAGLCIETALVVASALQSADMHAFLVFPPGHAQVAVEIWDKDYKDEEGNFVKGAGHGEYFLIETTCLSDSSNTQEKFVEYIEGLKELKARSSSHYDYPIVYKSAAEWNEYIKSNGAYILDCDDALFLGLTEFYH